MQRFPDWEMRLAAYLEPLRERPFIWGKNDCANFAAGAVKAMTGFDPMRGLRGYRTEAGAARVLQQRAQGTLIRTMNGLFDRVPLPLAHRGDLVMVDGNLGISLGAVSLHVGREGERDGLVSFARAKWRKAWCVPMPGASHG